MTLLIYTGRKYGHFAYGTLRLLVISPTRHAPIRYISPLHSSHTMWTSPTRLFAKVNVGYKRYVTCWPLCGPWHCRSPLNNRLSSWFSFHGSVLQWFKSDRSSRSLRVKYNIQLLLFLSLLFSCCSSGFCSRSSSIHNVHYRYRTQSCSSWNIVVNYSTCQLPYYQNTYFLIWSLHHLLNNLL